MKIFTTLAVPNTVNSFGAIQSILTFGDLKSVQLVGPGSDQVELWLSLDGSTFAKHALYTGPGLFPNFTSSAIAARAKRITGTTAGYSLLLSSEQADPTAIFGQSFSWEGAAAGTGLAETPILGTSGARRVARVVLSAESAVASDPVDFKSFVINAYDGAGAGLGTVAAFTTQSVSIVDFTSGVNNMILGSALVLPDNTQLTLEVAEGGAGVTVPRLTFTLSYSPP